MESLTIGAVARRTGVPTSTIRYYESLGLLSPPRRVNGRRRYDRCVFQQLVLIQLARQAGFGIREVQALVAGVRGQPPATPWQNLALDKITQLDAQIERAQAIKAWLLDALTRQCPQDGACLSVIADERDGDIQVSLCDGELTTMSEGHHAPLAQ